MVCCAFFRKKITLLEKIFTRKGGRTYQIFIYGERRMTKGVIIVKGDDTPMHTMVVCCWNELWMPLRVVLSNFMQIQPMYWVDVYFETGKCFYKWQIYKKPKLIHPQASKIVKDVCTFFLFFVLMFYTRTILLVVIEFYKGRYRNSMQHGFYTRCD